MLQFPGEWRFATTATIPKIPDAVVYYFHDILIRVAATSADQRSTIENFKTCFGDRNASTSLDWAQTDLRRAMERADLNSVVFIENLWLAFEQANAAGLGVPTVAQINEVLRRNEVGYELKPPFLVKATGDAVLSAAAAQGTTRERYVLGEVIGRGGFGQVYVATRETSAATFEFALKVLDPSPFVDAERALQRFRREVAALQGLQHRGIVPFVDAGVDSEGRPYVVMPRIRGRNIRDWSEGRSPQDCVSAIREVLFALGYAHTNGVLHRDLKPSNILVRDADQQPLILDFGNAYIIDELDGPSLTSSAIGSVGYMPPEVLANPKLRSAQQDVYAMAVVLYELIARRRPDPLAYVALQPYFGTPARLDQVLRTALGPAFARQPSIDQLHREVASAVA